MNKIETESSQYVEKLKEQTKQMEIEKKNQRKNRSLSGIRLDTSRKDNIINKYQEKITNLERQLKEYDYIEIEKLKEDNKKYREALTQWEVYNKSYIQESIDHLYNSSNEEIIKLQKKVTELELINEKLRKDMNTLKPSQSSSDINPEVNFIKIKYFELQNTFEDTIQQYESALDTLRKQIEEKDVYLLYL